MEISAIKSFAEREVKKKKLTNGNQPFRCRLVAINQQWSISLRGHTFETRGNFVQHYFCHVYLFLVGASMLLQSAMRS
jgi:hypothetical protein